MDGVKITNLRGIKLTSVGYESDRVLCRVCGIAKSCKFSEAELRSCQKFVPVIGFRPPLRGFHRIFNTFRLGDAWAKRVKKGTRVALADIKTEKVFALAEVRRVANGPKEVMAERHGSKNHNFDRQKVPEGLTDGEYMLKRLRNSYGTMVFKRATRATVIYLKVVEWLDETAVERKVRNRAR